MPQHIVNLALGPGLPTSVAAEDYEACPVTKTVQLLGDKWTLLVLVMLAERPHRYNELRRRVEGISQRMLTRTLRVLEEEGILTRTVHPTVPQGVEYALSDRGQDLMVPLGGLTEWVVRGRAA